MSIIKKEAANLDIMHFKLVSGDEIVALVSRNKPNESVILVEEPLQILHDFSRDRSSYQIGFQEWMPLSEDRVSAIMRMNIIAYGKCTIESKEKYLSTLISLHTPDNSEEDIEEYEVAEGLTIH